MIVTIANLIKSQTQTPLTLNRIIQYVLSLFVLRIHLKTTSCENTYISLYGLSEFYTVINTQFLSYAIF